MRVDRFSKEAGGNAIKARELRATFYKSVAPVGAHANCPHDSTKIARQACRRRAVREAKVNAEQGK